jgi:hypothetical protein
MKAIIIFSFAFLVLIASEVFCQVEAGQFFISGGAAFSRKNSELYSGYSGTHVVETAFNVNPGVGYMIKPRFMAGIGLGYSQLKTESTYRSVSLGLPGTITQNVNVRNTTSFLSSSVFLKYLIPLQNKIIFALGLDLQYDTKEFTSNLTVVSPPSLTPVYVHSPDEYFTASISPEIQAFLTKRIGVLAKYNLFNATYSRNKDIGVKNGKTDYHFKLDPSQFTCGVFMYLGGTKE